MLKTIIEFDSFTTILIQTAPSLLPPADTELYSAKHENSRHATPSFTAEVVDVTTLKKSL